MTAPDRDAFEAQLAALLAPSARASDSAFAARVDMAVDEARRYAAVRRRVWTRFGIEAASAASLGAGIWLLSRAPALTPFIDDTTMLRVASPLTLVLLLWAATYRWRLDERA